MEIIRILPHYAIGFFRVFYLDREPKKMLGWYNDERMKQNGISAINRVVNNPDQLIQIVSSYDGVCRFCPRNKQSTNFDNNPATTCSTYDSYSQPTKFLEGFSCWLTTPRISL